MGAIGKIGSEVGKVIQKATGGAGAAGAAGAGAAEGAGGFLGKLKELFTKGPAGLGVEALMGFAAKGFGGASKKAQDD